MTLRVWVDGTPVGRLAAHGSGTSFAYDAGVPPKKAVSLTMPPRVASYDQRFGLLPVFDMNLPEGYLREVLTRYLAKTKGRVTDLDILELVGGNMIGRVRVLPEGVDPERRAEIGDIGAILSRRADTALISEVMERYGLRSGVSGAMPKILFAEDGDVASRRKTVQTRDWILKFDAAEFPGLSLNEFWCMQAARAAGNRTAELRLGDNGDMLAVRRFDTAEDGSRLGFEDMAALNGLGSREKYGASIEKALVRNIRPWFGGDATLQLRQLFRQIVTSIALRNGDAHLKNYALLYESPAAPPRLSPAYDIVTTTVYIRNDLMALTLDGTTRWPKPRALEALGARAGLTRPETGRVFDEIAAGIRETLPAMVSAFDRQGLSDLGRAIAAQWNAGITLSLGRDPAPVPDPDPEPHRPSDPGPVQPAEGGDPAPG